MSLRHIPDIGEVIYHDGRPGAVIAVTLPPTRVGISFDERGGTTVDEWIDWPDEVSE